jgi:hypothetical protein
MTTEIEESKIKTINEELDFNLTRAIDTFKSIKDNLNKQTVRCTLFILLGAAIQILSITSAEIIIPVLGLKVDIKYASPVLFFLGGYFYLLRTLEYYSSLFISRNIEKLYLARFGLIPKINVYSTPGIIVIINRFANLGWWGQVLRFTLVILLFFPLYYMVLKTISTSVGYGGDGVIKIIFIATLILFLFSFVLEAFAEKITNLLLKNIKRF